MIERNKAIYQCKKCAKVSHEPIKECPICGSREIVKAPIVETKNWKR